MANFLLGITLYATVTFLLALWLDRRRRRAESQPLLKRSPKIERWLEANHHNDTETMWNLTSPALREKITKARFWERYHRDTVIDASQAPALSFVASVPMADGTRWYYYNVQFPGSQVATLAVLGDHEGYFLGFNM